MTSVEEQLKSTLRAQAGGEVDIRALLAETTTRGNKLRHRRIGALAATAAGLATIVTVGVSVIAMSPPRDGAPSAAGNPAPAESSEPPPNWNTAPALPPADGQPSAVTDPNVVGARGGLMHLSLDTLPVVYTGITYVNTGRRSGEQLSLVREDGESYTFTDVLLVADQAVLRNLESEGYVGEATTVGEAPATRFRRTSSPGNESGPRRGPVLRWQPAPGLWAEVSVAGDFSDDEVAAVAEAVRVDQVTQCVTPASLVGVPQSWTFDGCVITLGGDKASGQLLIGGPGEMTIHVPAPAEIEPERQQPNTKVAGKPAHWTDYEDGGGVLLIFDFHGDVDIEILVHKGFTRADAVTAMAKLRIANSTDLTAWPARPFQ